MSLSFNGRVVLVTGAGGGKSRFFRVCQTLVFALAYVATMLIGVFRGELVKNNIKKAVKCVQYQVGTKNTDYK